MKILIVAAAMGLATAAAAMSPALSVREEMTQIVEPASNTLFAVGGEADPANGPDAAKVADARWAAAREAAKALAGVASDMQTPTLARDGGAWKAFAGQMGKASADVDAAAAAHDGAGLANAANALSDACSACHARYKLQGAA